MATIDSKALSDITAATTLDGTELTYVVQSANSRQTTAKKMISEVTHSATAKTTPADADELPLVDSAASNVLKKLAWSDLKAVFVLPSRQVISGGGLTGGGDLSADRTLAVGAGTGIAVNADDVAVNINGLTADASPDGASDYVMTYDASATTLKKVLLNNLPNASGSVPTSRTITAGTGLTGGGDLSANRTISADINKQTIWVPAIAMVPRTTNGAASGSVEMSTNKNMVSTLDFDTTTQEFAQFSVAMPKSWNEGTITFIPYRSHASTSTNFGVVWGLDAVAISDDDTLDVAFGTEQTSTDTGGTTNDLYVGPESSAITIAGSPAAGDLVQFRIHRNPSDASDTLAIDARLHGVKILYVIDALKDD